MEREEEAAEGEEVEEEAVKLEPDTDAEAMVAKKRIPSPDELRDYDHAVAGQ